MFHKSPRLDTSNPPGQLRAVKYVVEYTSLIGVTRRKTFDSAEKAAAFAAFSDTRTGGAIVSIVGV